MSLPVIKAKTFDYGNYSRPQQIRYKSAAEGIAKGMQQAGQAIASAVLTSSSIKADAIRAKKKLDEELTIHQDRVLTNVASQLGADFASKNEDIIAKMVDDYTVMPNDSREVRNKKILGFQNEFEKLKSISDYQKTENPFQDDADLIAGNSAVDYFAQGAVRNGYVELEYDEENKTIKTLIPRVNFDGSKALGSGFGAAAGLTFDKEEVDISDIISRKINLKYDSVNDIRESGLELTPKQLQSLRASDLRFNSAIKTSASGNGQIITSYDPVKLKTLLLNDENPTSLNRNINKLVQDKAETIWEQKIRFAGDKDLGDFDGSDNQVDQVKEFVIDDLVSNYSRSALSIETPKINTPSASDISTANAANTAKNFLDEYGKNLSLYSDSVSKGKEYDILPLENTFKGKNHNKLGTISRIIGFGDEGYPYKEEGNKFNVIFEFKKGQQTDTFSVDLSDPNAFNNFVSEIGFVDSASTNQKVIDFIKQNAIKFEPSDREKSFKIIKDAEDEITPETLDAKQDLVEDKLLRVNKEFSQRQVKL